MKEGWLCSGVVGCGHGSWEEEFLGSVGVYVMLFLCSLILQISGSGGTIIAAVTRLRVPLKVSILAWRLLRNRLPTKDNLVTRDIISQDSQMCMTGCGGLEMAHHLFISYPCVRPPLKLGYVLDGHLISRSRLSSGSYCSVC